jgi:HemY protein
VIRFFVYSLLALAAGGILAAVLQNDPGYVLVSYHGWTMEATLASVVLALLALLILGYAAVWLLQRLNPLKLLRRTTWLRLFGGIDPDAASAKGLQELLLGNWQEAYRLLVENAERVDNPMFNYLAASLAAFERDDRPGWQFCLERAEKKAGQYNHAIKSLKAWLEQRSGDARQALSTLLALKRVAPASPFVLRQLKDIYLQLPDWEALAELLPELERYKVLKPNEQLKLAEQVFSQRLRVAGSESLNALHAVYRELPKTLRTSELLTSQYLQYLLHYDQDAEAGNVLKAFLKQQWSDDLVGSVGFLTGGNPQLLLLLLEDFLRHRTNNPVLMLTLGRLSLRTQLWGKAREYFEQALRLAKAPMLVAELNAELGRLLEHLGEEERSLVYYQRAMQLMDNKLPDLPMPKGPRGRDQGVRVT